MRDGLVRNFKCSSICSFFKVSRTVWSVKLFRHSRQFGDLVGIELRIVATNRFEVRTACHRQGTDKIELIVIGLKQNIILPRIMHVHIYLKNSSPPPNLTAKTAQSCDGHTSIL